LTLHKAIKTWKVDRPGYEFVRDRCQEEIIARETIANVLKYKRNQSFMGRKSK